MGRKEMSLRRAVAVLSFIGTDDFGREVFVDELGTIWKYTTSKWRHKRYDRS